MKDPVLVIGGGFFGLYIADHLARSGKSVVLCDKEADFMQRASLVNQARVHNGYHYPRSVLTALRSRKSFKRFAAEFEECIDDSFEAYYLIGKLLGKVTALQFEKFCTRIGASLERAPGRMSSLVNPHLVEAVYLAEEFAFDAVKLRASMLERIYASGVTSRLATLVQRVQQTRTGISAELMDVESRQIERHEFSQVFNCTYAMTNYVLHKSELELIPLKHEIAEICLVEPPPELAKAGITVMCGPFFSTMPFPAVGLHSFSHVRYTPHCEWRDNPDDFRNAHQLFSRSQRTSAWDFMKRDAVRYVPALADCKYKESIWEVKTVLPRSEVDDSRPILFRINHAIPGLHCVMGGKIDNIYDAVSVISRLGLDK